MRGASGRPGKRPQKVITIGQKLAAITRVKEGESKASVARDIGVPESTLRGWCKAEDRLRSLLANSSGESGSPEGGCSPSSLSSSPINNISMSNGSPKRSSDDEAGPSCSKKLKIDGQTSLPSTSKAGNNIYSNLNVHQDNHVTPFEYVGLLGMRPDNRLMLQQLCSMTAASSSFQNMVNAAAIRQRSLTPSPVTTTTNRPFQTIMNAAASIRQRSLTPSPVTTSLVENGLQYMRNGGRTSAFCMDNAKTSFNGGSANSKKHAAMALAPAQIDVTKAFGSRKSLPPAAEAPSTLVPASPRRSNENNNGSMKLNHKSKKSTNTGVVLPTMTNAGIANNGIANSGIVNPGILNTGLIGNDNTGILGNSLLTTNGDAMMVWMAHQQQLSLSMKEKELKGYGWFWDMYKKQGIPFKGFEDPPPYPKCPAKTQAGLDKALYDRVSDSVKQIYEPKEDFAATAEVPKSDYGAREAVEDGERFYNWLLNNSESSSVVAASDLIQYRRLIDKFKAEKWPLEPSSFYKNQRKGSCYIKYLKAHR